MPGPGPSPTPPRALVDVVIPTYDAREMVLECVRHLGDEAVARRIVVDDVSTDGTAEAVRGAGIDAVEVIELDQHRGLSHSFNRGAAAGTAPYVLFLNNDILAEDGAVDRLVSELEARPGAVCAGGRLVDPDSGRTQDSYRPRDFPGLAGLLARLTGIERAFPRNPWTGGHLRRPLPDDQVRVVGQQPAGACLLVRREAFRQVGGWDERFWFWYEDVDMARRLADLGSVLYVGPAAFRHVGRHSTSHWDKARQHRRLYHGTLRYGQSHLGRASQVVLAATVAAVCAARLPLMRRDPEGAAAYRELIGSAARLLRGEPVEPPAPEARRAGPAAGTTPA